MSADAGRKRNVLFVICDQLRADHLGFAGNPIVRTPNIDSLAARGTVFDRAYVNNPVCMPNRSTIMTGRMPSAHGVVFNDRSLPLNASTFVRRLRSDGWRTALVGKSHLQHGMSREAVRDYGHPGKWSPFEEGWDTVEHEPWMVWCSFPDPHHPMAPPEPWFSRHAPDEIPIPPTFNDPGEDWPDHMKFFRSLPADNTGQLPYVIPFGASADIVRAATAATYGMIEMIDHGIGRILATIDRLGATDDTIVVFTSDHGDMGGDHGVLLKGVMHFQGCVRTPLVVVDPARAPQRTRSLAASVDLPSTVLDLCGVDGYHGMQGTSLRPVLDDPTATVRDAVLVEDDFPLAVIQPGWPLRTRTVITDTHRYTRDTDGFEMLYDLVDDPDELVNLAVDHRDPGARIDAVDALVDEMTRADDLTLPVTLQTSE
ncbi:MAG: hypothetical protein EBY52_04695 [Actinobacteria bacterium]|nr:hypothetical protein [Actinomycetota bacterium]